MSERDLGQPGCPVPLPTPPVIWPPTPDPDTPPSGDPAEPSSLLANPGDIITSNGTSIFVLPVGSPGWALVADPSAPAGIKWAAISSSVAPGDPNTLLVTTVAGTATAWRGLPQTKSASFTVTTSDQWAFFDVDCSGGAVTATLPTPGTAKEGFRVSFRKKDSSANLLSIVTTSGTINGVTSLDISSQYHEVHLLCVPGNAWALDYQAASFSRPGIVDLVDQKFKGRKYFEKIDFLNSSGVGTGHYLVDGDRAALESGALYLSGVALGSSGGITAPTFLARTELRLRDQHVSQPTSIVSVKNTQNTVQFIASPLANVMIEADFVHALQGYKIAGTNGDGGTDAIGNVFSGGILITKSTSAAGLAVGGNLSGTVSNATVTKIQGTSVSSTAPNDGELMLYKSSSNKWEPTPPSGVPVGGDLSGNVSSSTVNKLQGFAVSPATPGDGDLMLYKSGTSQWEPSPLDGGTW